VPWNETFWVDDEFDALLKEAERTLDVEARRAIMCKLEDIQMERGSIGVPFFANTWHITHERIKDIEAHPQGADLLEEVYIDEA
jgi:peptide/nickel transport system substrate-binding protein